MAFLVNQRYARREVPFGESPKSSKKSLYKIDDPFLHFYFTFLVPNKSRLEFDLTNDVWDEISAKFNHYLASVWEHLARKSVPDIKIQGHRFNPAGRWWGPGSDRKSMEIDLIATSTDGKALLIGEAKWSDKDHSKEIAETLSYKAANLPFAVPEKICKVLFQKKSAKVPGITVITPENLLS
jgi:AAA+ ATPase superfamily predicted ATPase